MNNKLNTNEIDLIIFSFIAMIYWYTSHDLAKFFVSTFNLVNEQKNFRPVVEQYQMLMSAAFGYVGMTLILRKIYLAHKDSKKIATKYFAILIFLLVMTTLWLYSALKLYPRYYNLEQNSNKDIIVAPIHVPQNIRK